MQDITIAAIQMNALCGECGRNLARHVELTRKAAAKGAELVCFPELSVSGHFVDRNVWKYAEPVPGGPACRTLEALAKETGAIISAGIAERARTVCYNTQALIGPDGFIGKYRKTHASRDEYFYFRMGAQFPVFNIGKCTVGIMICYDIHFPEVARSLAVQGAEVLLAPHASRCGMTSPAETPERLRRNIEFFSRIGWARSWENGVFMVINNQAGDAGEHLGLDVVHCGGIVITAPDGSILAKTRARKFREEIVVSTLAASLFESNRSRACHFLQTRRPEVYGALTDPC